MNYHGFVDKIEVKSIKEVKIKKYYSPTKYFNITKSSSVGGCNIKIEDSECDTQFIIRTKELNPLIEALVALEKELNKEEN